MSKLSALKAANAQAFGPKSTPGLVAVFVGGTAGIGEYTAKAFTRHAVSPRIYIVGRSEASGSRILAELQAINPAAHTRFIQADITSLAAVDRATAAIAAQERSVNVLFLTAGFTRLTGRAETAEGLDEKMAVHYYGRVRFALNLLPQLRAAAAAAGGGAPIGARVLSVLSPGTEGPLATDDLELRTRWTLAACARHAVTMGSLALETLAAQEPAVGWAHVYPSFVMTEYARELPAWARAGTRLIAPLAVPQEACGEGMVGLMAQPEGRTGLRLVAWDGADRDTRQSMSWLQRLSGGAPGWWSEETRELVWKHTLEVMARVPRQDPPQEG